MGNCIICGTTVDGAICASHEEDVVFRFRGDSASQLSPGRYYRGTVDGYADFGVFVDVGDHVTGLLHRSELDRRLESLDWESGDTVFVQVLDVRDNGNVDLGWSIRQSEREFRGVLVDAPDGEYELDDGDDTRDQDERSGGGEPGSRDESGGAGNGPAGRSDDGGHGTAGADTDVTSPDGSDGGTTVTATDDGTTEDETTTGDANENAGEDESAVDSTPSAGEATAAAATASASDAVATQGPATASRTESGRDDAIGEPGDDEPSAATDDGPTAESGGADATLNRSSVEDLSEQVGTVIRLEGEIASVRQTGGPTVFELRDETGTVECAAFEEAGVRAYPDVDVDDVVALEGEVEKHQGDLQVETERLVVLEDDERETVADRLEEALEQQARPPTVDPLADHEPVVAVRDDVVDAATAIRRAVMAARPVVVRHSATADGYVAGAAIERATLPLIREKHTRDDAVYHYFERRPLDGRVYDMDAATGDATSMLEARDRHGEQLPLVVLVDAGSTLESADGYDLLDVYDAERLVIDAGRADGEIEDAVSVAVAPSLTGADVSDVTSTALAANVAAHVNDDVRDDLALLPAISYWEGAPSAYVDLATEAGYDETDRSERREAVALEAYYQSYKDKRELVTDLLWDDDGDLAGHVSEQFRDKLATELETARENVTVRGDGGVTVTVLDTDAFTHRYDFPPTDLLLDALHRRERDRTDGPFVTLGVDEDELRVRSTGPVDVRDLGEQIAEAAPEAGVRVVGGRDGRVEFLAGERVAVREAAVEALEERLG